jgi:hypothetical protein
MVTKPEFGVVMLGAVCEAFTENVADERRLTFPKISVALAETVFDPSANGDEIVADHEPLLSAMPVAITTPLFKISIVAFASVVPIIVVVLSPVIEPFAGETIVGGAIIVSTPTATTFDKVLVFPDRAAVAVIICGPSFRFIPFGTTKLNGLLATVDPMKFPSMKIFTVVPGSLVPPIIGVLSFVLEPLNGVLIIGGGRGTQLWLALQI